MKIRRFSANDMRTALAQVRDVLGPDAIILSSQRVGGAVEIVAAVDPTEVTGYAFRSQHIGTFYA